jgi:hypothetical protein
LDQFEREIRHAEYHLPSSPTEASKADAAIGTRRSDRKQGKELFGEKKTAPKPPKAQPVHSAFQPQALEREHSLPEQCKGQK